MTTAEQRQQVATGWHNFRTGETDWLYESPTDYSDYISQHPSAQMLYRLYQEMGDTPQEAALKVLTAMLPKEAA